MCETLFMGTPCEKNLRCEFRGRVWVKEFLNDRFFNDRFSGKIDRDFNERLEQGSLNQSVEVAA